MYVAPSLLHDCMASADRVAVVSICFNLLFSFYSVLMEFGRFKTWGPPKVCIDVKTGETPSGHGSKVGRLFPVINKTVLTVRDVDSPLIQIISFKSSSPSPHGFSGKCTSGSLRAKPKTHGRKYLPVHETAVPGKTSSI